MADACLELAVGEVRFSAEGSERWVDQKFSEFLARLPELSKHPAASPKPPSPPAHNKHQQAEKQANPGAPLAIFLREHNAANRQVNRFLATAIWLQRNGLELIKTSDVAKALLDARQQPLTNPSDVLNQNVGKGFCVKTGEGFYVTPEGEESLSS